MKILNRIDGPRDLKPLNHKQLGTLSQECRDTIIETITKTGGHLASNLGVVELTLALHRAFGAPALSRGLEAIAAALGLRALFGSPVIARFDRV